MLQNTSLTLLGSEICFGKFRPGESLVEEVIREAAASIATAIRDTGPGLHDLVRTFIFAAGAIGVYLIAWVNARSAKNRRTVDIIRTLIADPDMLQRSARIYSYRRRDDLGDPYEGRSDISYQHDLICVLNLIDTACIEIKEKMVSQKKAKEHLVDCIVGAEALLDELDSLLEHDPRKHFPVLVEFTRLWK